MAGHEKTLDAVVVGNVGIDTNVYHPGGEVDWNHESNFTENVDCVGQAGGYSSRGFAQLGWRTAFIGHVGEDWGGRFVRDELARDGIDLTALFLDPAGTSRSVNLMFAGGGRKNFYDGKSHMELEPDPDVCSEVLGRARLAHFHLPHWARRLLGVARDRSLVISCDLQDMAALDDPYRRDFIEHAEILFFSAANTGRPDRFLREFLDRHPRKILVMGMGAEGCALGYRGDARFFEPVEMATPVLDTNGAGDALAVGFLTAFVLEGRSLEEAVLRGQIAARHTCSQKAASSRLIRRAELESHVAKAARVDGESRCAS